MLGWSVLKDGQETFLKEEDVKDSKTVLYDAILGIEKQCETVE